MLLSARHHNVFTTSYLRWLVKLTEYRYLQWYRLLTYSIINTKINEVLQELEETFLVVYNIITYDDICVKEAGIIS